MILAALPGLFIALCSVSGPLPAQEGRLLNKHYIRNRDATAVKAKMNVFSNVVFLFISYVCVLCSFFFFFQFLIVCFQLYFVLCFMLYAMHAFSYFRFLVEFA